MNKNIIEVFRSPWKFRLFLIKKVPMAYLAGLKLEEINDSKAVISIRYKYLTQNPFRSIYFACLAMAGELASGSLAFLNVFREDKPVSMLVVGMEAIFTKKAVGKILFTCNDGDKIREAVQRAIETGEGQQVIAVSVGVNEQGEKVAEFKLTWSFKARSK